MSLTKVTREGKKGHRYIVCRGERRSLADIVREAIHDYRKKKEHRGRAIAANL